MKKETKLSLYMLPLSIQRLVKRRIILRIVAFVLLEAISAFLVATVLSSTYDFEPMSLVVICAIILLTPFFISGFPLRLIDKPWCGRIIAVDVETKSDACMVGGKPHIYIKNSIVLTIEKENGKFCTKEVISLGSSAKNADYGWEYRSAQFGSGYYAMGDVTHDIENYRVGDEVYHFYGLDDLVVRREGGRSIVECVACSTANPAERDDCFNCGHTLIKHF